MIRLVEYSLKPGTADEHEAALRLFLAALADEADGSFSYSSFRSDDPARFFGLFEYQDDAARDRFFATRAFAAFRKGALERFSAAPDGLEVSMIGRAG